MRYFRRYVFALLSSACLGIGTIPVQSLEVEAEQPFECAPAPEPIVSLSIGSRYAQESATKSEISEESNEDVDRALEPVENFINDLSGMANAAYLGETDSQANADCAMVWLDAWAVGEALTELNSLNAKLAVSPRLAGIALAYLQAQPVAMPDSQRDERIRSWMQKHAEDIIAFFDTEAGPLASTNNLRAWAALATAATGRISGDEDTLAWSRVSYKLLVCGAENSGALPAEMERGERALHYQLHAVAPLVVAIALLDPDGEADDELCRSKLEKIAQFTLAAVKDPSVVADLVGKDQVFSGEDDSQLAPYQLAWAEAYLARYPDMPLEDYIQPLRPLGYSKLGGDLTAIYGRVNPVP